LRIEKGRKPIRIVHSDHRLELPSRSESPAHFEVHFLAESPSSFGNSLASRDSRSLGPSLALHHLLIWASPHAQSILLILNSSTRASRSIGVPPCPDSMSRESAPLLDQSPHNPYCQFGSLSPAQPLDRSELPSTAEHPLIWKLARLQNLNPIWTFTRAHRACFSFGIGRSETLMFLCNFTPPPDTSAHLEVTSRLTSCSFGPFLEPHIILPI
jgi:hypothetical protein